MNIDYTQQRTGESDDAYLRCTKIIKEWMDKKITRAMTNEYPMIPPTVDSVPGAFQNTQQAFHASVPSKNGWVAVSGMTLTDYFAAQYMSAGKLPDEAFRLARLAMKEREAGV